jgi:hypothetical protein
MVYTATPDTLSHLADRFGQAWTCKKCAIPLFGPKAGTQTHFIAGPLTFL